MSHRFPRPLGLTALFTLLPGLALAVEAGTLESSAGPLRVEAMVTGLEEPWGLDFLPDGAVIVAVEGQSVGNLEEFYVRVRRLVNTTRRTMRQALVLTVALPQGGYRDVEVPLR